LTDEVPPFKVVHPYSSKSMKTPRRLNRASSILFQVRIATAGMLFILGAATFSVAVLGAGDGGSSRPNANADSFTKGPTVDTSSVLVQLKGDPLSTYVQTKPPQGKKIDFNSNTVKSYRAQLSALRNDFKKWLQANAPKAKVTGQYDISLNAVAVRLNGTAKSTIEQAPQAKYVEYQGIYYPNLTDPDLNLINALTVFSSLGGGQNAGKIAGTANDRIKVGVIDTGIDVTHPCFNDTGFPVTPQQGPSSLTNNKVIVAKVFNNKAANLGLTPEAVQAHGTHVAGTVGCDYGLTNSSTIVDGVTVGYGVLGVAPGAQLGNYNVFPGTIDNARSEDILNALEAAFADGMDIVNMSIGGGPGKNQAGLTAVGNQDLLTMAVDDLDQAGMISAVAAGNSGPGFFTVESPGSAARALTAGAVTVGHWIGVDVEDNTVSAHFNAAVGDFGPYGVDITAPLSANLGTFCGTQTTDLTGKIALINRGTCTFSEKIRNAQNNAAAGAIIVNNVFGPPIAMGSDGTANQPTIVGVMVGRANLASLNGRTGNSITIHSTKTYIQNVPADNDFLAGFSSRGPTAVDFRVKPDVTAPGVNVLSSIPNSGPESCGSAPCWAFLQGTSMATPHLAGSAAVVLGQHPTWSSASVRSAIVNTADSPTVKDPSNGASLTTLNAVGTGRENLDSAVNAKVALDPVSVSFGAVPAGSGQTKTFDVTLTNLNGSAATFTLSVGTSTGTGVSYSVTPSVTLAADASGTVTVTMTADQGASSGFHDAALTITGGGGSAHAGVFTFIK
jgi:minor extracellular serine protease Vpr